LSVDIIYLFLKRDLFTTKYLNRESISITRRAVSEIVCEFHECYGTRLGH